MTNKYVPDNFIFPLRWASASVYEIPTVIAKTKATIDLYLFSYHLATQCSRTISLLLFGRSWFHLDFENYCPSKNNAAREKMARQHYMNEAGTPKPLSVAL